MLILQLFRFYPNYDRKDFFGIVLFCFFLPHFVLFSGNYRVAAGACSYDEDSNSC